MQEGMKDITSPMECEKSQGLGKESVNYIQANMKKVISNIEKMLEIFRKNNLLIIYTQIGHLYKDFKDASTIHKKRYDEFFDEKGEKTYLMPGNKNYEILNEFCPEKGEIILQKSISDGCIASDKDFHENALRVMRTYYSNVMETDEIINQLRTKSRDQNLS